MTSGFGKTSLEHSMPRHRFQLLSGFKRPHGIVDKAQLRRQHLIHTCFTYNLTPVSSTDERSMEFLPCRIGFGFHEGQKGDKRTMVHSFHAPLLLDLDKPYCMPPGRLLHLSPVVSVCVIPHQLTPDMTRRIGIVGSYKFRVLWRIFFTLYSGQKNYASFNMETPQAFQMP